MTAKELFIRFTVRGRLLVCEFASLSFGFEGGTWDFVVIVPDHCLSIIL